MTTKSRLCPILIFLLLPAMASAQASDTAQDNPAAREAQRDKPESDVQALLKQALLYNPDIVAARSAVAMAEAELNRARQQVARELLQTVDKLSQTEKLLEKTKQRQEHGTATVDELLKVQNDLIELRESLRYLVGTQNTVHTESVSDMPIQDSNLVQIPRPEIPDGVKNATLRRILDNPITLNFEDTALIDVLDMICDTYEINFVIDAGYTAPNLTINVSAVPLQDMLEAISDQSGGETCFVIRDYGFFVTSRERAVRVPGPSIPAGVPYFGPSKSPVQSKTPVLGDIPMLELLFKSKPAPETNSPH